MDIISDSRIKHMHGVAELMYSSYDKFGCKRLTRNQVYMLGLNHDIGYIEGASGHNIASSMLFSDNPYISNIMFWHSHTPQEYEKLFGEVPAELALLWYADNMIESTGEFAGQNVGLDRRLACIGERYGKTGQIYKINEDIVQWLKEKIIPRL